MSKFSIDFFELMFLADVCIPPVPIVRSVFFENLSELYINQMSDDEIKRLFEHLKPKLDINNQEHKLFLCRFDITKQFSVLTKYNNKKKWILAFKMDDKYHVSKNKFIDEKYIIKVKPANNYYKN